ncbi:methionine ABC transporter ATP-binding protein [Streptomyces eurocidicus]|uniref:D-methionine transport system ATP-binding protein n=1 Tax=Streptomyces eurocidicus TaxID=66423 RepID=A0A7W8F4C4_STREU|nr:methionine ABC transporter ATP-binding protein [Streptomyces eurocidicus]MBB5120889.1 D-methionine transport system ATP-binding protein [Streptomyces eurocidicus]MBF6054414.1 ATP-binding cassette domain-containing protein [Streptomyces eurocidicus]
MIELRHVTKTFPTRDGNRKSEFRAVDDVSLTVERGSVFGIVGHSGAGKSTLLRVINYLEEPTSGSVLVDGQDLGALGERRRRAVRRSIGMVFQQFHLFRSRTVLGNVAYPLGLAGHSRREARERAGEALRFVGLEGHARRYPEQLSGGQRQRVGIARALATSPKVLLCDEATSALDPQTTGEVLDLLERVNAELGVTIVLITHEMDVVRRICDRVAVMADGRVVESGGVYDVFARPKHIVTSSFVRSALHDVPEGAALERLRARHGGRLVTVPVTRDGADGPDLSRLLRRYGLDFAIAHAGVGEVQHLPLGSVTLELRGPDDAIDAFLTELAGAGEVAVA